MFQSLAPGEYVDAGIIDCWSAVLNFEDRFKPATAVARVFLNTSIFVSFFYYYFL